MDDLKSCLSYQKIKKYFFHDVNGDGYDDLIFFQKFDSKTYFAGNIYVYACLSNGANQFLPARKWAEIDTAYDQTIEALADVNGDKACDLIVKYHNPQEGTNAIHVWLADKENRMFIPSKKAWFEDSSSVLTGETTIVGAGNIGVGAW